MVKVDKQILSFFRFENSYSEKPVRQNPEGLHKIRNQFLKLFFGYLFNGLGIGIVVSSKLHRIAVIIGF